MAYMYCNVRLGMLSYRLIDATDLTDGSDYIDTT